ncbi:uncharacterized protein LOC100372709 [Saccoglossus kowalevskii]|uniref:Small vasohibin-binding protein n=1 Tax=Saccoglossus kowalevskii TaxID=10224 RepID=A0ABM0GJE6_SACKO|nr:PREDICTED: uncharacterized protein LOC100372709 [Saccoglossus kowalevskii]
MSAFILGLNNRNLGSANSQGVGPTALAPTICRAPVVEHKFNERRSSSNLSQRSVFQLINNTKKLDQQPTCLPQIVSNPTLDHTETRNISVSHQRQGVCLPTFSLSHAPCPSAKRRQDEPIRTSIESTLVKTAVLLEGVHIENSTDLSQSLSSQESSLPADLVEDSGFCSRRSGNGLTPPTQEDDIAINNSTEESIETPSPLVAERSLVKVTRHKSRSKIRCFNRNGKKSRARSSRPRKKSAQSRKHPINCRTVIKATNIAETPRVEISELTDTDCPVDVSMCLGGQVADIKKPSPTRKSKYGNQLQSIQQATLIYGQQLPRVTKACSFHGVNVSANSLILKSGTGEWKLDDYHVTRVYLSQKQSGVIKECGNVYPCAPPATPTVEQQQKYEYVPCMSDIRSQRAVKSRLTDMQMVEKKKKEKRKEEAKRAEIQKQRDNIAEQRQRQRLEIYALNKVMTQFENDNFRKFCAMQLNQEKSG